MQSIIKRKIYLILLNQNLKKKKIEIFYFNNDENSGAVARNLGAAKAKGDLIAFLDDDVILDKNYYYEIEKVFMSNDKALGVQGLDSGTFKSERKIKDNIFNRCIYCFEKVFMVASFLKENAQECCHLYV